MVDYPTVAIAGAAADPALIARPLTVTHGRSGVATQPDAPTTEILWCDPVMPWQLGDPVVITSPNPFLPATYDDPVITYDDPRALYSGQASAPIEHFAGTIDSIEATEQVGTVVEWRIGAVGGQAALGRIPITITRPAESDVSRVAEIADAAGIGLRMFGHPGVQLAAATIDTDVLSALQDVCLSSGGLVWQSRHGDVTYGAADHRIADRNPVGVLDPSDVVDGIVWTSSASDLINDVTVGYGPDTARAEYHDTDAASVVQGWGVRHTDITTTCNLLADAQLLAQLVLARRAWPYWSAGTQLVDLGSGDALRLFSRLDVSKAVMVPWPVDPGPTPSAPAPVVVEGWVETWEPNLDHLAEVALSDQHRWVTTTLRTYTQLQTAATTYDAVLAMGTYSDALIQEG